MAENKRETSQVTAQDRSVVNMPQLTNFTANNVTISTNVQYRPEETNVDYRSPKGNLQRCQDELKKYLQNETKDLFQGTDDTKSSLKPLNEICTQLYITEGDSGEVNSEHEVIELDCRRCASQEKKINLNDIFKPSSDKENRPQRILTKGIAGIGKSVAVQKFIHDWADGTANQTIQFVFPFTFRDLNSIKDKSLSLVELISKYFEEVKDLEAPDYSSLSVLFIFEGLDESKLSLDFKNNEMCRSITEPTSVDAILTNLIKGKLLHKALIWITSRPAAADKIPPGCIHRVTEVRGFNNEQKEEYFKKEVKEEATDKILSHLHSLKSLYIMCHIPVFCWVTATVLQDLLRDNTSELPKTVTEMFTQFVFIQMKHKQQKHYQQGETDKDLLMKLGKLAFEQLQKDEERIFSDNDLKHYNIDLKQAVVYSGLCTEIISYKGFLRKKDYSFVHLSVREFLAALYVLESFIERGENLLHTQTSATVDAKRKIPIIHLHKSALDMALKSDQGKWDLFLRFLLGLSQDKNQEFLQEAFGFQGSQQQRNEQTIRCIHEKLNKPSFTDILRSINLFHCLNELGDQSLVEQVKKYQSSGDVSKISPAHWSALAYELLVSSEDLDVFDLRKYSRSDEALERMLPVLKSKTALLSDCNLSDKSCRCISSVLSLKSGLKELDLSRNELQDSGMELLSEGLKSPNCKLQILSLKECSITRKGCLSLASALALNPSHLRELDLSRNNIHDGPGPEPLSEVLNKCSLETLRLCECGITEEEWKPLASALSSNPSHLKNLDLSRNRFEGQAVALLSDFLKHPDCQLQRLWLVNTNLQQEGAAALASALVLNPTHLRELELGENDLGDAGVKEIAALLKDPNCKVETLRLSGCTESSCEALASALRSNPSHLRELELSGSNPGESGLKLLSDLQKNKDYKLQTLKVTE